jgi:hypothetical protein
MMRMDRSVSGWRPMRRFFAYYRPHRGLFSLDFGCAVISGLLELGFPVAVRRCAASWTDCCPARIPGHGS